MGVKIVLQLLLVFVVSASFLLGVRRIALYGAEENKCDMTYMFEYPQYIKIELPSEVASNFSRYNLYVYGEGELAERYNRRKFKGLPVLFIPGNAGSYKQVRSLASVAYRKALDSRRPYRLDYFSIDFDEELSAFHGGLLERQVAFTRLCIRRIMELYGPQQHSSVVLIGHSMGGMIAKAVLASQKEAPGLDSGRVHTIITLATPHRGPVVATDSDMVAFYDRVQRHWSSVYHQTEETANVSIASIGGGDRDIQVRSGLVSAPQPSVNVLTTEIPGAWVSVDHLCIAWCKQVVTAVVRALFDMVDTSSESGFYHWLDQPDLRNKILQYHLIQRFAGKSFENPLRFGDPIGKVPMMEFDPDGRWREVLMPHFVARADDDDRQRNTYFMVPLLEGARRDSLVAVAASLPIKHWVFGCVANAWRNSVRFCEHGTDLSPHSLLLPNSGDNIKRKLIQLDLTKLKEENGFTHVIFIIPKNHLKAKIHYDVLPGGDRNFRIQLPFYSYFLPGLVGGQRIVAPSDSLSFNVSLPELTATWHSLAVSVNCKNKHSPPAFVRKVIPWSHEGQFFLTNRSFTVHLHTPKTIDNSNEDDFAHLQLINPTGAEFLCEITVQPDWTGMWAQLIRFYGPFLFPLVSALFLCCLGQQLKARAAQQPVPSTLSCLLRLPVLKTIIASRAVIIVFGMADASHLPWWPFPPSDDGFLWNEGLQFPLMHPILGAVAWVWALLLAAVFWLGISFGGNALHSFVLRYLRGALGISSIVAEAVTMALARIPVVISVALVAIGLATCGSLALLLGFIVCIWKLFDYYEDELESMINGEEEDAEDGEMDDAFHINSTIGLMWLCSTLIGLPALIVWVRNPHLTGTISDPSLIPGMAWSLFGMVVLQRPTTIRPTCAFTYNHVAHALTILSLLMPVYALISLHRVQLFLAAGLSIYACRQLM